MQLLSWSAYTVMVFDAWGARYPGLHLRREDPRGRVRKKTARTETTTKATATPTTSQMVKENPEEVVLAEGWVED